MTTRPSVMITGASMGIGAAYADRFAKRGHDLVLVARNHDLMELLAERLRVETGVSVDVLKSDLTNSADLANVEQRLRDDSRIGVLINNAGTAAKGSFAEQTPDDVAQVINLNTIALARLASAVTPRFVKQGAGSIVNIASVVAFGPEFGLTVYGATKAFTLFLTQGMHHELAPKGIYVQAVLPAATRTKIWEHSGIDINALPAVMEVDELVDAALTGYDRRETVTIPPLADISQWEAYEAARITMRPGFAQTQAAKRYKSA